MTGLLHHTGAEAVARAVTRDAVRLEGSRRDFDPLLDRVGNARFVLIGEASHGTHEFYRVRAEITKALIREHGFTGVAVEADWPDAWRVNRFVRGDGFDAEATDALGGFRRFPQWMWRNADVLDFVGWLQSHNDDAAPSRQAGFYGLDLYSLHSSMAAVIDYLDVVDPDSARLARERYACFDRFGADPIAYGRAATLRLTRSCEREVLAQLVALRRDAGTYALRDGRLPPDAQFVAEQNARLVLNAERYYRTLFLSDESSWNLRDRHMADTLSALSDHLGGSDGPARLVVWAHNSHLGDARETEMAQRGELNLGQLVRAAHGTDCVLVGFTTSTGTVTAASDWDGPAERKRVVPALEESYEGAFAMVPIPNFFLDFRTHATATVALQPRRLERAIGVIYRPATERASHYFRACLPRQFDAVFHYDETRAVEPLERTGRWERGELPETYPTAL